MMSYFYSIKLSIVGVILIASIKADLVKRQANDDVCKDAESPASECFEYFKLSLHWPKASCYKVRLMGQSDKECNTPDSWSVHGLWPQRTTDKSILKKKCPLDKPFNIDDLNDIKDKLTPVWFGVDKSGDGDPNAGLWEHEWTKHGRCAARVEDVNDIGKFFSKTLDLYGQYDLGKVLKDGGIPPGNTASIGDISNKINDSVGKKSVITTFFNKDRTESFLHEIHICYDLSFNKIDCPEGADVSDPDKQIKYLDDVPSVTG